MFVAGHGFPLLITVQDMGEGRKEKVLTASFLPSPGPDRAFPQLATSVELYVGTNVPNDLRRIFHSQNRQKLIHHENHSQSSSTVRLQLHSRPVPCFEVRA